MCENNATSWPNLKVETFQIFSWAEFLSWAECDKNFTLGAISWDILEILGGQWDTLYIETLHVQMGLFQHVPAKNRRGAWWVPAVHVSWGEHWVLGISFSCRGIPSLDNLADRFLNKTFHRFYLQLQVFTLRPMELLATSSTAQMCTDWLCPATWPSSTWLTTGLQGIRAFGSR